MVADLIIHNRTSTSSSRRRLEGSARACQTSSGKLRDELSMLPKGAGRQAKAAAAAGKASAAAAKAAEGATAAPTDLTEAEAGVAAADGEFAPPPGYAGATRKRSQQPSCRLFSQPLSTTEYYGLRPPKTGTAREQEEPSAVATRTRSARGSSQQRVSQRGGEMAQEEQHIPAPEQLPADHNEGLHDYDEESELGPTESVPSESESV